MTIASNNLTTVGSAAARAAPDNRAVGIWLLVMCGLIFAMVVVGGATRLTDSGLSITEWRPVTGTVPPLSPAQWESEFDKYRQIPEYQFVNKGMSLEEFKVIYWWEWGHRFLGRIIGLAFFLPFMVFLFMGKLAPGLQPKLWLMFALGGAQGAMGWFMVMSGLTERVDVSQYRLVAHLGLAVGLFAFIYWVALDLLTARPARAHPRLKSLTLYAVIFAAAVYVQFLLGGFVAGLRAGASYATWPLMNGAFFPSAYWIEGAGLASLFESHAAVQFNHRLFAYGLMAAGLALWWFAGRVRASRGLRRLAMWTGVAVLCQAALGIWTVVAAVPISLGASHQAGAMVVFAVALTLAHRAWAASRGV